MRTGAILTFALLAAALLGCSSSKGASVGDAGSSSSAIMPVPPGGSTGVGVCEPICPRSCDVDNDCNTEFGELCCDYGAGKVCQEAQDCPVFCTNDSVCQTSLGQACIANSLTSGSPSLCADAGTGLRFCQTDDDCGGGSQTCCTNYDRPICTDLAECPAPCSQDSQCNAQHGEVCCTTVQAVEPNLSATGLCLNPAVQPCPKTCTASSDCGRLSATPLCCNGFCAATCTMTCTQDSDCFGEICCKSPSLAVAVPPVLFAVAPGCGGEPAESTCADCFLESGACNCLGCSSVANAGACTTGTLVTSCEECGSYYNCEVDYCPGCAETTVPGCTGTPSYTLCDQCGTQYCGGEYCPGCTVDDAGCSGSVTQCAANTTEAQCSNESGCRWNAVVCAGTVVSCESFTSAATCNLEPNCEWEVDPARACTGSPTPCGLLSLVPPADGGVAACNQQPGCFDPFTASDGGAFLANPDGGFLNVSADTTQ